MAHHNFAIVVLKVPPCPLRAFAGEGRRRKGTKAVTGAVPFQKVQFCTQRLHIGTLVVHINT